MHNKDELNDKKFIKGYWGPWHNVTLFSLFFKGPMKLRLLQGEEAIHTALTENVINELYRRIENEVFWNKCLGEDESIFIPLMVEAKASSWPRGKF